jgi:hypothetical protein
MGSDTIDSLTGESEGRRLERQSRKREVLEATDLEYQASQ